MAGKTDIPNPDQPVLAIDRNRRKRRPVNMARAATDIEVPWANCRVELKGFGPAQETVALKASPVWQEVAVPAWREIDSRNARRSGKLKYTTEEGQAVAFYRRAGGFRYMNKMLDDLQRFDLAEERNLLGLGMPRNDDHVAKRMRRIDGVPSKATMTRLISGVPPDIAHSVWKGIYEAARAEELSFIPLDELLTLYVDSSNIPIVQTCPVYQAEKDANGKRVKDFIGPRYVVNHKKVRNWDGGQLPKDYLGERGLKATMLWTGTGSPLGFAIASITSNDNMLGAPVFDEIGTYLKSRVRGQPMVGVVTGDSGFTGSSNRLAIRAMGYIDNISATSAHNEQEASSENARHISFRDKPGWWANGHREINCACGTANVSRVWKRSPSSGLITARVEASCPLHGSLTVTSGEYVETRSGWAKYDPLLTDENGRPQRESADLRLGNGLTYNDWMAREYATKRWGHNEGFHGALTRRGQLFDGGNSFGCKEEVEIAFFMLMTALHIRGAEYRRRVASVAVAV